MKRILFLVSSMQGGGAERVAALLCNHWAGQGHCVTLMPTFSGGGECLYPLGERVRLDYLADRVGNRSGSALNKVRRLLALRRAIREIVPDAIVSFLPHVNVAAVAAAMGTSVPVVVSERTYPPLFPVSGTLSRLRRWAYPRAAAVVMQTEKGREWVRHTFPGLRAEVIANPVVCPLPSGELRLAPGTVVAKNRRVLLAVGRLAEQKDVGRAMEAFAALAPRFPDWDLVVLGQGPERAQLEAQREALGLAGRVHLPGRVGNLAEWYQRASLYVMSSRFEGFPNTLLEAMAHGLPAVSVDCDTGPRDIIRSGLDGSLVAPQGGTPALTEALGELMADPQRRASMGAAAAEVRERYAMARIAAEWDRVLGLE